MEKFSINGENGSFIEVSFEEVYGFPQTTCHWGGYEVRTKIEVKSGGFSVASTLWTSTGELYEFCERLKASNLDLAGTVIFNSYEENLNLKIVYDNVGHVNVSDRFSEQNQFDNELIFKFNSDQSYLGLTVNELREIVKKYGDMKGINLN